MLSADEILKFMEFFRGSSKAFMEQQSHGGYIPSDRLLEADDIKAHLKGSKTVGAYLIEPVENTVNFLALDIDIKNPKILRRLLEACQEMGIKQHQILTEDSGNKGWHIWLPFSEPVPAAQARSLGELIYKISRIPEFIEIFPKQTKVKDGDYGNGIKLPLGIHKKSNRRSEFIDPDSFKRIDDTAFLKIQKIDPVQLEAMLDAYAEEITPKPSPTRNVSKPLNAEFKCINNALEGVSEGHRDTALFNLVTYYLYIKKLPPAQVVPILLDWNQRNNPPLDEEDISKKVTYVFESGRYDHFSCKALKEFCDPHCPNLNSDGKNDKKVIQTSFFKFPNGNIAEMVYSSEKEGRFAYVDPETNNLIYADKIETEKCIYQPYEADFLSSKAVLLPSEAKDYGTEEILIEAIRQHIHKYLDIDPVYEKLCTYFVLFTYLYDRFHITPYLRFTGESGCGKSTALKTIGEICYKPIFCAGAITSAPIFRFIDLFQGTLVLDEFNLNSSSMNEEIIQILNAGYMAGVNVLRCEVGKNKIVPRAFNCYGPKLIATRESFQDDALESRCLTIVLRERKRDINLVPSPEEFSRDTQNLRDKLLLFRLHNFNKVELKNDLAEEAIEDRLNQIIIPVLSIIKNEYDRGIIVEFMRETNRRIREDRSTAIDYEVLKFLNELRNGEDKVKLSAIAVKINEKALSDREKVTERKIGYIIKERFRLRKKREADGTYAFITTEQLTILNRRYGYLSSNS